MKIKTIALLVAMCYLQMGHSDAGKDKEGAYRMVVYANENHYYNVTGESFFSFPRKIYRLR